MKFKVKDGVAVHAVIRASRRTKRHIPAVIGFAVTAIIGVPRHERATGQPQETIINQDGPISRSDPWWRGDISNTRTNHVTTQLFKGRTARVRPDAINRPVTNNPAMTAAAIIGLLSIPRGTTNG